MVNFEVVCLAAMLVVSTIAVPVYEQHHQVEEQHYEPARYEFKYGVKDEHTHDIKEQYEKRDGDKVEGYYKLVEPDGTVRTVKYTADKHTGFIAQVEKSGHATHPRPIKKVIAPVKKLVYPVKKVVYPVKYQSYEPDLQQSFSQEASHYEVPAQIYSNEHSSLSDGSPGSYSSFIIGGGSEKYGHQQ
ncbi:cuticle protein 19-like isoform X2 [Zootermopsis nevadensis]|uniref:cuticle protein 19-like isoform X2 n=1 Tax=Zootermopsis nevadensis TaxID=136037 RepID=UPI000B8E4582|nr:cuticle protein 19-like isoform X2 [Zootermopsis nevadensis]